MLRFSLFGFPVTVHWMFWLVIAMLGGVSQEKKSGEDYLDLLIWVVAAFVSILIHELGHTFLQRRFGARAEIHLYAMGGLAIPDRSFTRGQDIIISLAGPVVQILCGIVAWQLVVLTNVDSHFVRVFLGSFVTVSIFWGLLNLLPILPLDGGHVLKGIVGQHRVKIVYLVGLVCCLALAGWVLTRPYVSVWNALICGMFAWDNFQRLQGSEPPSALRPQ